MKWGPLEIENWRSQQKIKRSYQGEVVSLLNKLNANFNVRQYGALSIDPNRYPLFLIESKKLNPLKETILVTGGVHGYETSGVHGAIGFFQNLASHSIEDFNFIGFPCISPWGYETINRWNHQAIDPNRSFFKNSPAEECELLLKAFAQFNVKPLAHFDLHETTDTDNTVFRPALEQRDGIKQELWDIPDGFYLVGDVKNPAPKFQKAIIDSVKKVTPIAPSDKEGKIIGVPIEQEGVINYDIKKLSLCASLSQAPFVTTTEVYPDSPRATAEICVQAQIAAVEGGIKYLLQSNQLID